MNAVSVKNVFKTYEKGSVSALDNVSLEIAKGELFGLIGPDGAGKTSLFRILTTLLLPDMGSASLLGYDTVKDYREIRNRVGYMPGKFSLYQDLSVAENLAFFATLFNTTIEENYDLVKDIYEQIKPFSDRRAGKLSGGMKQKLALCCALIHKPEVLLLDEPTTGVDVVSRKEFWDMLKRLKEQGITILVSTPYMDEAVLCERIALIQSGKILSVDTPQEIIKQYPVKLFAARAGNIYKLLSSLRANPAIESSYAFGEYLHVTLKEKGSGLQSLQKIASDSGITDTELKEIEPTIEDSFIRLMNQTQLTPAVNG
ncbi:MAG: ABC transporter ATP-binding protein [Bacteroidota bacterium]